MPSVPATFWNALVVSATNPTSAQPIFRPCSRLVTTRRLTKTGQRVELLPDSSGLGRESNPLHANASYTTLEAKNTPVAQLARDLGRQASPLCPSTHRPRYLFVSSQIATFLPALTPFGPSARVRRMVKAKKFSSSSSARGKSSPKPQKRKPLAPAHPPQRGGVELVDPRVQAQMKLYDEALGLFHQQKFQRAKQELEKILEGPSKELADRARMHIRIAEQRMKPSQEQNPRTPEDHYQRGVAMMNLGRWDDARESLDKARKLAPKADHIVYALAALDCLTGEADAALANLKIAIELRSANRYHARNDEDFAFLQEDPRFTELLYPEKDGGY